MTKAYLLVGDTVTIYGNPVAMDKPEGKATLIKRYRPDVGDGLSIWWVEFLDEPGQTYLRTISTKKGEE